MEFICLSLIAVPVLLIIWLRSGPVAPPPMRCRSCSLPLSESDELADLAGTLRRLDDLRAAGVIDEAGGERLRQYVENRREKLVDEPKPAPIRTPAPALPAAKAIERPFTPLPTKPIVPQIVPPIAPEPPKKRRSLNEWLAAFMEERNVLWGELVGGLLVVGCSTALVLSLWQTLERIPLFPFLVMVGVTSALFGVGQYTLRKWRLESTSRGLLAIATLLVPLDFLVLAGLSPRSSSLWEWAIKLIAIPVFAWLIYQAARVLFSASASSQNESRSRATAAAFTFAILGAAVTPLVMPRLLGSSVPAVGWLLVLGAWPIVCHCIGIGLILRRYSRLTDRQPADGIPLLSMTALAIVPLGLALGFLVYWIASQGGDRAAALEHLAALIAIAGVPTLLAGLFVQKHAADSPNERTGLLASTATGTALLGMMILLLALALAWPNPIPILVVGLINFVVLTAAAFLFRMPPAHGVALPCLTAAYLAIYWIFAGAPTDAMRPELAAWQMRQTISAAGGAALIGLATIFAIVSDRLRSASRLIDSAYYSIGAGALGIVSVALVGLEAVAEPARATAVVGWAASVCLLCGQRWQWLWLKQVGSLFVVGATMAALHWLRPDQPALWGAILAAESLVLCAWPKAGRFAAALAATLAVTLSVFDFEELRTVWPTITALLLAAAAVLRATQTRLTAWTWLGSGVLFAGIAHFVLLRFEPTPNWPWAASLLVHATLTLPAGLAVRRWQRSPMNRVLARPLTQSGLFATIVALPVLASAFSIDHLATMTTDCAWLAVLWLTAALARRSAIWFAAFQAATTATVVSGIAANLAPADFLSPLVLRHFLLGLSALAIGWAFVRRTCHSRLARRLLDSPLMLDRVMLGALVIGQLGLAAALILPGIFAELQISTPGASQWRAVEQVFDRAGWLALGALAVALAIEFSNPSAAVLRPAISVGLVLVAATVPVLTAGYFADERAIASALRWGLALAFTVASIPIWLTCGPARAPALKALLVVAAVPIVLLTLASGSLLVLRQPLGGPVPESLFAAMGATISHCLPLALLAVAFAGHALRERSGGFAFAGGLIANLAATGGYAIHVAISGTPFDMPTLALLLQISGVTTSLWAIGWLLAAGNATSPLRAQIAIAAGIQFTLLGWSAMAMIARPENSGDPWVHETGTFVGALGLLTTTVGWLIAGSRFGRPSRDSIGSTTGLLAAVWFACFAIRWDSGDWLAFHALAVGWAVAGGIALTILRERRTVWVSVFAGLLTLLAVRSAATDPLRPYAPALAALVASGLLGGLAVIERRAAFVAASGGLFTLSGLITWFDWGPHTTSGFISASVLGLSTAAAIWALCNRSLSAAFRQVAMWISVAVLTVLVGYGVIAPVSMIEPLTWAAWIATVLAIAGALRDRSAAVAPELYAISLTGALLALLETGWTGELYLRAVTVILASFVLIAQLTARFRRSLPVWLTPAQIAFGGITVLLSLGVSLSWGEPMERLLGPFAAALLVAAFALLAGAHAGRATAYATIGLGTLVVAEVSWAILDLGLPALGLHRVVAVVAALAFATIGCSFGLVWRLPSGNLWAETARRAGPVLGLLCAGALAVTVGLEGASFDPIAKRTPLGPAAIGLVAAAFVGLMAAALAFAVRPWTDPFGLSERRRPLYVYGTELLLVLLFLHLRFNVPGLFPPIRGQYWAFVVMGIAFVGVSVGEFLQRRKLDVVAGPLRRTGLFLPLLPLLVFWLNPPEALRAALIDWFPGAHPLFNYLDAIPRSFDAYGLLWFLFGSLYLWLAVTRRSYWYSLAAALAANVGLWALLHHGGIAFLAHPQVWLIPGAFIILASEHHHRDTLAPEVSIGLRFAGLSLLYLSSTADLFITGLGNSVLLPLVLMVLSVSGVLAGILFRVRSYVYLGAAFLGLVVFTMIWHAAVDREQTWIWWASGVALGIAILALFALFEKRRPQVLQALGEFRTWST